MPQKGENCLPPLTLPPLLLPVSRFHRPTERLMIAVVGCWCLRLHHLPRLRAFRLLWIFLWSLQPSSAMLIFLFLLSFSILLRRICAECAATEIRYDFVVSTSVRPNGTFKSVEAKVFFVAEKPTALVEASCLTVFLPFYPKKVKTWYHMQFGP